MPPLSPTRHRSLSNRPDVYATHLVVLAEMLADDGPLAYLRFAPNAWATIMAHAGEADDAWLDAAYAAHITELATPAFVRAFCQALTQLAELPYVPEGHRQAAATAVAMTPAAGLDPAMAGRDAPALYVLFCVQARGCAALDSDVAVAP